MWGTAEGIRLLRASLDPGLLVWSFVQNSALPFRRLKLAMRRRQRLEISPRWAKESGGGPIVEPAATAAFLARPGTHVAFTGLGYGEFVMIKRVVDSLRAVRPDVKISVALRHDAAIEHVRLHHPELHVSRWPADAMLPVLRWLASERPDVVALTEGYREPALVVGSARYGARVALLNGRGRDRASFHKPLLQLPHRWLIQAYAAIAMQHPAAAGAVRDLVAPDCDLLVSGDLKTDFQPAVLPPAQWADLQAWLAVDCPLLAAGSTDNLEEERMVLAAFRRVRAETPCVLLLAPRQPQLVEGLAEAIHEQGLTFARRSERSSGQSDVLLLDTQGELANAYAACVAAYVGGSYNPRGNGHNPVEPLALGLPVAYGLQRGHFEAIQSLVEEAGVGTRIADEADLAAFWLRFLRDPEERTRVGDKGREMVEANRGAVERSVAMLTRLLPPLAE